MMIPTKKTISYLAAITIVAALSAVGPDSVTTQALALPTPLPPPACDIAGSWVGTSPPIPGFYTVPVLAVESVTPTDAFGIRFTAVIQPANGDPTLVGLFPDADRIVDAVGTYARSGPRAFQATWVDYFVKSPAAGSFDRGQILYWWVLAGSVECMDGNTRELTGMLSVYSNVDRPELVVPPLGIFGVHDQDLDDDGFADEGELPFVVLPFEFTFKRLPLTTGP